MKYRKAAGFAPLTMATCCLPGPRACAAAAAGAAAQGVATTVNARTHEVGVRIGDPRGATQLAIRRATPVH